MPIEKPDYIDPAGDPRLGSLPVSPPFSFLGVTARVFPLKASMVRLTQFCDSYLNMDIPPEIVHYRPTLPYVYLMVLNYGSMSPASVQAQNVGWVAQHEVTFTVLLQRWRKVNGKLVFKDWANVSPFIFVDDEVSQTTGREVYGWPKVLAQVVADMPAWTARPRAATRLFSLSTHMFGKVYAGQEETPRVLLQIDCDPSASYAEFPPHPGNPWFPLSAVPKAVRNSLSLMGDAADMVLALPIRGFRTDRDLSSMLAMAGKAGSYLTRLLPDLMLPSLGRRDAGAAAAERAKKEPGLSRLSMDSVTLKQFRDPEDPNLACYKALVNSSMGVDRLNECGLLGDVNFLRGDPSGGYTVRIHQYTSQPIIESLGLEVAATEQEPDGGSVAILKPSFPIWTDVDLYYGKGQVICSRTPIGSSKEGVWIDELEGDGAARPEAQVKRGQYTPSPQGDFRAATAAPGSASTPYFTHTTYNAAQGAATQPVVGPFHFPDVTVQVYPLLADRAKLDGFVERYLNDSLKTSGFSFKTCGSYAYLMVTVYGDQLGTMWSSSNNIGWWAEREVAFCVPVKWYQGDELVSLAMIEPLVYANNGRAVITDREVNGRASVAANIDSPKDIWLTPSGPAGDRRLLHMETEIFPALNLGQKAEQRTLLEIDQRMVKSYYDTVGWRMVQEGWGRELIDDLKRKTYLGSAQQKEVQDGKALALEILAHEAPVNRISLKQYRDAGDVESACYQAAVHTPRSITCIYDVREIENPVAVRLHRVPGHPIAEALGLKIMSVDSADGNVIDIFQPLRPFWMRVGLKEELGTVIGTVKGMIDDPGSEKKVRDWDISHPWFKDNSAAQGASGNPPEDAAPGPVVAAPYFRAPGDTRVGSAQLQNLQPQRLKDQANTWLRRSLTNEMTWIKGNMGELLNSGRGVSSQKLSASDLEAFERLEAAGSADAFCDALSIESLMALVCAAGKAGLVMPKLTDAPNPPLDPELRRLTRPGAAETIEKLDEMQLVLDSILSDEWENWGNPRFFQGKPRKPDEFVPNGEVVGQVEKAMGIESEEDWWFVPPRVPPLPQ